MAKTIAGLQLEAITKGPWLARRFPAITNAVVYQCVTHWNTIGGSAGERMWAERAIKQKVCKAFPFFYAIIIKIIVSLIISWMLDRRSYKFNREVEEIYKYLQ
tara:strand:- start:11046 stop:11354 length:309 start_codon:yes stop_codon:yes gene_type:complete